ncbi:MAG TPA: DUF2292 domain-containing protein [Pseudomonas sp.]|nr:DUF2292 domain-containing protein [Pseudomonadales bacterium]MAP29261.1 DUF2292 domain-containing protein [Pseudomonas sp.]MEE3158113.1 DUF2292 domain-containing protein [Pseudomonadota bacterium]MAQ51291.1 DUF2292 domain-containing protein [Pseudomonas sp.]MBB49611.1 DUF2292 domain-containing protein [Pseudomonadales bacterium]|tara:strand:+ start:888 stop:1061 length:174 start_codon:yes stop_codon:yes gene_type:complete
MTAHNSLSLPADDQRVLAAVAEALKNLQFGAVEITLHNGQVVQIERKEKFRFQSATR